MNLHASPAVLRAYVIPTDERTDWRWILVTDSCIKCCLICNQTFLFLSLCQQSSKNTTNTNSTAGLRNCQTASVIIVTKCTEPSVNADLFWKVSWMQKDEKFQVYVTKLLSIYGTDIVRTFFNPNECRIMLICK